MSRDEDLANLERLERLHGAATELKCPACGVGPGEKCKGVGIMHAERLRAVMPERSQ